MNKFLKHILIIILSFLLFYWIQTIDDKKYKISRITLYQKFKNPLLFATIIGLILNLNLDLNIDTNKDTNVDTRTTNNNNIPKLVGGSSNNSKVISKFNKDEFTLYPPPFP